MATTSEQEKVLRGDWPASQLVGSFERYLQAGKPITPQTWSELLDSAFGKLSTYSRPPKLYPGREPDRKFSRYVSALQVEQAVDSDKQVASDVERILEEAVLPGDQTPGAVLARLVVGGYVYDEFQRVHAGESVEEKLGELDLDMANLVASRMARRRASGSKPTENGTSVLAHVLVDGFKIQFTPKQPMWRVVVGTVSQMLPISGK